MAPMIMTVLIFLLITGLFCYTITQILDHVAEENRSIQPKMVWLLLIPGFNWIWNFVVAFKLSSSIKKEMEARNFDISEKPTFMQGILYSLIYVISVIPSVIIWISAETPEEMINATKSIPENLVWVINGIFIMQVVLFITYWSKIRWYKNILENDEKNPNEDN